jgi:isoleucyl-tRNA synthetase
MRQLKTVGKSLDAKIVVPYVDKSELADGLRIAASHNEDFRELLNVSALHIWLASGPIPPQIQDLVKGGDVQDLREPDSDGYTILVAHADGQKCERCWHWETDIGQNAEHPTICGRCIEAVLQFKT